MSFTSEVKDEVSKLVSLQPEMVSELSAIVSSSNEEINYIKLVTENNSVARRIFSLFKDLCNIYPSISVRKGYNYNRKIHYVLEVKKSTDYVFKLLGIKRKIPEMFIWDDEELSRAHLRGLFLMCGSVNDPKKSRYHLEFNLDDEDYANFVNRLLNVFKLNSKLLHRDNNYMVYVKEAEKIGDFLRIIGATKAVLYYEDIRIYRDHKNMTNRLNNCEQANVDRIIETADSLIKDIELIEEGPGLELLGEKEMEAAIYRKRYPDASISELSEIISIETGHPITKSGLYHRLKKVKEFAKRLREK
ncbi:MAG: DNA-binding protein WhiA [Bacilli bacterium]|nr:DNA-binding protein WhiA [Bacilli bacterium]